MEEVHPLPYNVAKQLDDTALPEDGHVSQDLKHELEKLKEELKSMVDKKVKKASSLHARGQLEPRHVAREAKVVITADWEPRKVSPHREQQPISQTHGPNVIRYRCLTLVLVLFSRSIIC